jgi:hypothetical protein
MRKPVNTPDLVAWYTEHRFPLTQIALLANMSRQGVWKRLKAAGVAVTRVGKIDTVCVYCGVAFQRYRAHTRQAFQHYCCAEHYYAARENREFVEWRQGSRLARAIVAQHYPLSPVEVVHHKDGNQRHNDLANLMVYASQADHLAAHHGRTIAPVWDGAAYQ